MWCTFYNTILDVCYPWYVESKVRDTARERKTFDLKIIVNAVAGIPASNIVYVEI